MSYWELTQKIKLKYGELSSIQLCHFSSLAEIARAVFGGGEGGKAKTTQGNTFQSTGSLEGDVSVIRNMLRVG